MARIQFILKARESPFIGETAPKDENKFLSSGLLNSATFVKNMLTELGHITELSHAIDNNCIDRLVTKFKPDIVIIEAFWVVPEKFDILTKLHPKIEWIVRNHSAIPFLANEGIGIDWTLRYIDYPNVALSSNDARTNKEIQSLISIYKPVWSSEQIERKAPLLSNYYPVNFKSKNNSPKDDIIDIACFGAIRPLKNHLMQAIAAIQFAKKHKKHLNFHINGTRIEMKGDPILQNLRKMFKLLPYDLIEHDWMPHDDFCSLLRQMDVSMQVSYTETFNIVTADAVMN